MISDKAQEELKRIEELESYKQYFLKGICPKCGKREKERGDYTLVEEEEGCIIGYKCTHCGLKI